MGWRGKHKNKRDANEPDVIAQLEAHGVGVVTMDTPCDLLCLFGGVVKLLEVKSPKGKLTKAQTEFIERWPGYLTILRSTDDADQFARDFKALAKRNESL